MNQADVPLKAEVRGAIDAHLDAIDRELIAAGLPREPRRNITDNVETQILDMLAERTAGRAASMEDIQRVLAGLDPPSAFAAQAGAGANTASKVMASPPSPAADAARLQRRKLERRRNLVKTAIVMTMLFCGTLLVATPAIHDTFRQRTAARLMMVRTDLQFVSMGDPLTEGYRFFLGIVGMGLLICGMINGAVIIARELRKPREP